MELKVNEWTPLDTEPMEDGTVGGDGASWAYSARWARKLENGNTALITQYFYPVDLRERLSESDLEKYNEELGEETQLWEVEGYVEYLICTDPEDPGSTEVWSDIEYDDMIDILKYSENRARTECYRKCMDAIDNFSLYFNWSGEVA